MKKIHLIILALIVSSFVFSSVFAQTGGGTAGQPTGGGTANQPTGGGTANEGSTNIRIGNPFKGAGEDGNLLGLIYVILDKAVKPIGGVIVVIMIIYSGFLFVTARGSEDKISEARRNFTYTAIGAAILLGSVALAKMIEATIKSLQ